MGKHAFHTIMLLAEGTDAGMEAARVAISLAQSGGSALHIVSVVDTHTLKQLLMRRIFVEDEMAEYEKELEASCRKQLDYLSQLAAKGGVPYHAGLLTGACHTCVLAEQKRTAVGLLVMGSYRATTIKTDLMGREKQLIVDEIPCPVLLVPAAPRR